MLVFAIWAALFKMMADSGRSWRTFSAFDSMGTTRSMSVISVNGAEGDSVGRFGLILECFSVLDFYGIGQGMHTA